MVEKTIPTKDERTVVDVSDTLRDNLIRTVDEFAKAQPQYSQSISNLQLDYIQTIKNMIQTVFTAQRQFANTLNVPSVPYGEVFTRQSNEVTNNTIRSVGINNQLTINALDAARENLKIYNRTVDTLTDFYTNIARAWATFYNQQQQQFAQQQQQFTRQ
ncbi:MAG TPA: hypothetical protein VJL79_03945 [Nitrososphaera sp.]|jgi:hypothetical protein|nr:hypothetical protein [Nitrososphaera sp.]